MKRTVTFFLQSLYKLTIYAIYRERLSSVIIIENTANLLLCFQKTMNRDGNYGAVQVAWKQMYYNYLPLVSKSKQSSYALSMLT